MLFIATTLKRAQYCWWLLILIISKKKKIKLNATNCNLFALSQLNIENMPEEIIMYDHKYFVQQLTPLNSLAFSACSGLLQCMCYFEMKLKKKRVS